MLHIPLLHSSILLLPVPPPFIPPITATVVVFVFAFVVSLCYPLYEIIVKPLPGLGEIKDPYKAYGLPIHMSHTD